MAACTVLTRLAQYSLIICSFFAQICANLSTTSVFMLVKCFACICLEVSNGSLHSTYQACSLLVHYSLISCANLTTTSVFVLVKCFACIVLEVSNGSLNITCQTCSLLAHYLLITRSFFAHYLRKFVNHKCFYVGNCFVWICLEVTNGHLVNCFACIYLKVTNGHLYSTHQTCLLLVHYSLVTCSSYCIYELKENKLFYFNM